MTIAQGALGADKDGGWAPDLLQQEKALIVQGTDFNWPKPAVLHKPETRRICGGV